MIPGPASHEHVQWQQSPRHETHQSARISVVMAISAIDDGDEYHGCLKVLERHELVELLDLMNEHAAARKAHR